MSWTRSMAEPLLLALVGTAVALAIAWPLLDGGRPSSAPDPEAEALQVRHRLALEALRDVEADHRAGSLDDERYRAQRDEAEARAAQTMRELEAAQPAGAAAPATSAPARSSRRMAVLLGGALAVLVLAGYALPSPFGIAERDARIERIRVLTDAVTANPQDVAALAELSDLYLQGGSSDDVARALVSLVLLVNAEPEARDGHERLVSLLIRAGLWEDAEAATDRFAEVVGDDDREVPFFRGLIARGLGHHAEAIRQFDLFLELAPDDPREAMVRGLREDEAAAAAG
jgi:tetratricopeptide (TPR) repeat protein